MAYSENILTLTYDFLLYIIPQLAKYPRDQIFLKCPNGAACESEGQRPGDATIAIS